MLPKWPRDHPGWPVIYMVVGAGCLTLVMFATATDLSDGSEVRTIFRGGVLAAGVGWLTKKMFMA